MTKIYITHHFVLVIYCQDPCTIHRQMNDPTRSVGYTLGSSETEGCDRLISEDWYRFQDDANMPTECPPVLRCGSTGPIWINGILIHTLLSTSTCIVYKINIKRRCHMIMKQLYTRVKITRMLANLRSATTIKGPTLPNVKQYKLENPTVDL